VDETYSRDGEDFLSCYEETKYRSHEVALDRISKGAPIVIVQPGGVYGPGDHSELGNIIDQARTGKLKPPSRELPVPLMKMAIPIGPLVGRMLGFPPNLRELVRTSDGVTYWASDTKARRDLGYAPRDMETGLRQTLGAGA
jgi:nucleoside-diphosphate-sugar epimerase